MKKITLKEIYTGHISRVTTDVAAPLLKAGTHVTSTKGRLKSWLQREARVQRNVRVIGDVKITIDRRGKGNKAYMNVTSLNTRGEKFQRPLLIKY